MTMPPLPTSLRRDLSEYEYQQAKLRGETRPLHEEPALAEWRHWKLINNRYPYDAAFQVHHMLLPKRIVSSLDDLTMAEVAEMMQLCGKDGFVEQNYHLWFANTNTKRSILTHFHIHLARFYSQREEMGP